MFDRKGQSTLEYALIIAVVVGGLLLMQHYVKRGYSGRLKSASDEMGEQFDPGAYTANFTVNQSSNTLQTVNNRVSTTNYTTPQISSKTGSENIAAWNANQNVYGQ